MEETTTPQVPEETGAIAQPVEDTQAAATQEPVANQEPPIGDNSEWLKSKGIDPTDPQAVEKLAKSYREAEQLMSKATQKASELEKTVKSYQSQPTNEAEAQTNDLMTVKNELAALRFRQKYADASEYEPKMVEKMSETSASGYTYGQLVAAGVMSLDDIYSLTKAQNPTQQPSTQEVLQSIANKQRAGSLTPNATNQAPIAEADPITEAIRKARG